MSRAKEEILNRIQSALADVPDEQEMPKIPRNYRYRAKDPREEIIALFSERVAEYKAVVQRVSIKKLAEAVQRSCRQEQVKNLVVPEEFPADWVPEDISVWYDNRSKNPLSNKQLDRSDGVITTCARAIAQTGTIILDAGAGQGRRAVTLVPDYHLCVVKEEQIVGLVPEAIDQLKEQVRSQGNPLTMISGPSATSDIELSRVEGVHGPRRLEVLIVSEC